MVSGSTIIRNGYHLERNSDEKELLQRCSGQKILFCLPMNTENLKHNNTIVFPSCHKVCDYQIELGSQSSAECVTVGTDCLSLFLKRM